MLKKIVVVLSFSAFLFRGVQGASPSSEVVLATALEPPKPLALAAVPTLVLPEPAFEERQETSAQVGTSLPWPYLRTPANFEKTFFDANLVAMVGLNVADYFSTRAALKYQGLNEWNPLMKPFVKSPVAFAAAKLGTTALAYWSFKALFKHSRTLAWIMTTASNGILSYVLANNLHMIQVARSR